MNLHAPPPPHSPSPPTSPRRSLLVGAALLAAGAVLEWRLHMVGGLADSLRRLRTGHRRWADGDGVVIPESDAGRLELFVLAGQSNMSGRGRLDQQAGAAPDRLYVFGNDDRWHRAVEPIDNGENQVDAVSFDVVVGVGPGLAFGERWRQLNPDAPVGLIPCAMGGSAMADWRRNRDPSTLYGSMLRRCRAASTMGNVRGVLFFQGESDANAGRASHWNDRFAEWVSALRQDLGDPELPVVFAQLGEGKDWIDPQSWNRLQERQAAVDLPGVAMITTRDLPLADGLHFTTEAYRTIGLRFADAMHALKHPGSGVTGSPPSPP